MDALFVAGERPTKPLLDAPRYYTGEKNAPTQGKKRLRPTKALRFPWD